MKSKSFTVIALIGLWTLAGCSQTLNSTLTTGQLPAEAEARIAAQVCRTFPNQTHDSELDTRLTSDQIKLFNQRRDAYCKENAK